MNASVCWLPKGCWLMYRVKLKICGFRVMAFAHKGSFIQLVGKPMALRDVSGNFSNRRWSLVAKVVLGLMVFRKYKIMERIKNTLRFVVKLVSQGLTGFRGSFGCTWSSRFHNLE